MLALLHTAHVHVDTFASLARELDDSVAIAHDVQERLLAETLKVGTVSAAVQAATSGAVRALVERGAKVVLCTCSTIGGVVEQCAVPGDVRVMRVDRPMAELAVASGRRILVLAALATTFGPTSALLNEVADRTNRSVTIKEVWCEQAWRYFERGDRVGYHNAIAATIESAARPTDVVVLAQASMAPAAERVTHLGIPVLSSPKIGLEAAMSTYRTLNVAG